MNILAFHRSSVVDEWIERARVADIVQVARNLQPRLRRAGAEWVGPCPRGCAREDGFAIAPRKGVFVCRPSGAGGDVIAMVMHALGRDFNEACAHIVGRRRPAPQVLSFNETLRRQRTDAEHTAAAERRRAESDADEEAERILKRKIAAGIWASSYSLQGSIGENHFAARGLDASVLLELRFHPRLEHWFGGGCLPAVVARVTSKDGDFLGVHATFLTQEG